MYGFYGEWAFSKKTDRYLLKKMSSLSAKRGPDSTEFVEVDGLFSGFNRLAILDKGPSGMQPMTSPSGRYTIVYNGEVYNHKEIRKDLKGPFHGHSDTETIVHTFDKYGIARTVDMLDGMFAIVAWDGLEKQLHLVTNPNGNGELLYFSIHFKKPIGWYLNLFNNQNYQ